jgi:hypothetical protein
MKKWFACVFVLLLVLTTVVRAGDKEKPPKSLDPYGTAERGTPQPVAAADLAYHVVLFDEIEIPDNLKKDNAKYVDQTKTQAMTRLRSTQAFTKVDVKTDTIPDESYMVVKCVVLDHHIVGGGSRFFAGALAGKSHVAYQVKLFDGKSGDLLQDAKLSTANNAFAGAFLSNDKKLVPYLGNVVGDYVALRARTDKGVSVIPLDWPPPAK